MTKQEKIDKIEELKKKASELKKGVDYYNALQLALKLVLNGTYGAISTQYFILFNNYVAGTITAEGRELTKKMDEVNEDYWYEHWHDDVDLHKKLCIRNVKKIPRGEEVSIYGDTDSIFVGFEPAINSCDWENLLFNEKMLGRITKRFIVIADKDFNIGIDNTNYIGKFKSKEIISGEEKIPDGIDLIIVDGIHVKNNKLNDIIENTGVKIMYNWDRELDLIHAMDRFKIEGYFLEKLQEHANSYGVENKEDFELERISESIINIAKKKYIQHILFEDGIFYDRLTYLYPKGVELVRSSTPAFAREKIVNIVKYLFENPDTFNIKDLLSLVKGLRKEFELAPIDDIAMQSSCSNYDAKIVNDKKLPLEFVSGAHFAVKASAYHNYLLNKNTALQKKYEYIKSGTKIKYYYCKDKSVNGMFAYIRGSFPIEMAPEVDYDEQFMKSILSPINSIIEPLGLPEITKRLSVVMDIFQSFK